MALKAIKGNISPLAKANHCNIQDGFEISANSSMLDPSNLLGTSEINTNNIKENVVTKFLSPSSPIQKVLYTKKIIIAPLEIIWPLRSRHQKISIHPQPKEKDNHYIKRNGAKTITPLTLPMAADQTPRIPQLKHLSPSSPNPWCRITNQCHGWS